MPLPTRPKNRESSNLVITIKYGGLKATQFFSKYTAEAYQQLLNDLSDLGFPHPKRNNIVFLSHGTLEFFWPIALHEKVRRMWLLPLGVVSWSLPSECLRNKLAQARHSPAGR